MITHPLHQFIWGLSVLVGGWLVSASTAVECAETVDPIRVVLLSGQNNHDWRSTTPKIKSLLESTGRFKVGVEEHPERLSAKKLKPYDVIVSDWNSWDRREDKEARWPEALQKAYVDFVRSGGGHVVVHAGSSSFPEWDGYLELTLATWKLSQTGVS